MSLVFIIWYGYAEAGDDSPLVTPNSMISVFAEDTCAPPCWFGLIPGESDRHDVIQTLMSIRHLLRLRESGQRYLSHLIIDLDTNEAIGWSVTFAWSDYFRRVQSPSRIELKNGQVDNMQIYINQEISLRELLSRFGYPDYVYLWSGQGQVIILIYEDALLRVEMYLPDQACTFENMTDVFTVWNIRYYSSEAGWELTSNEYVHNPRDPQPRLLYLQNNMYEVSQELFEKWLSNEESGRCYDVWQQLRDEQTAG